MWYLSHPELLALILTSYSFVQQYYRLLADDRTKLPVLYQSDASLSHSRGSEVRHVSHASWHMSVIGANLQIATTHHGRNAISNFFDALTITDVTLDLDDGAVDAQSVGNGKKSAGEKNLFMLIEGELW